MKGRITSSVAAMLQQAGLVEGDDYTTVLLDGFDPKVHIEVPNIVGFPATRATSPSSSRQPASRSRCSIRPTTASPAASASCTRTPSS
ncbi:MAG: hypothetical protein R2713_22490 [Ilumatobacteraceae bacterium]